MRVAVDAVGYDSAARALVGANRSVATAYDALRSELGGYHALGGDDTSSEDFVREYDAAAAEAVDALAALVAGLGSLGEITQTSARNHRRANAGSVYGRAAAYSDGGPEDSPVTVRSFTPPSSLGGDNTDVPDWWNHVVDHLQGWGWPSANTGQLRDAASAWRAAAGAVDALTSKLDAATGCLEQQRSPEIATATQVIGSTRDDVADLADCLSGLGDACEDYATQVDETRATIRGLLKDLAVECGVTAGMSVALSFVTFGGAAVVGTGVVAARAITYARRILAALRALKAARAVLKLSERFIELSRLRKALESLESARKLSKLQQVARHRPVMEAGRLQKKFKHAKDFGVDGNFNPSNATRFENAVYEFVDSPGTLHRSGTHRGDPVTISFNPSTGRMVMTSPAGDFVSGWKMTYAKLPHAIRTGDL